MMMMVVRHLHLKELQDQANHLVLFPKEKVKGKGKGRVVVFLFPSLHLLLLHGSHPKSLPAPNVVILQTGRMILKTT